MAAGGWVWDAERGRWVAHAPLERTSLVVALVGMTVSGVAVLVGSDGPFPRWLDLLVVLVLGCCVVSALARLRCHEVTCDGEVVVIRTGPVRTRFRPADVEAMWKTSWTDSQLATLRVHRPQRSIGRFVLPALRRRPVLAPWAPTWWWIQIVGVPPERVTVGRIAALWIRLRRRLRRPERAR